MDNTILKRFVAMFVALAAVLSLYGATLYEYQIVHGAEYASNAMETTSTTYAVNAARGSILDRNGVLLASDEVVYDISLNRSAIMRAKSTNDLILELAHLAQENGVSYNDTFPVTMSGPFQFRADATEQSVSRLLDYMDYYGVDENIPASDLIIWMKEHYGIDYTTSLRDARMIIGIRYELDLRLIINIDPYVFAEDVDESFVALLAERDLAGVSPVATSRRVYHTPYAAHLLGYTGQMNAEEYEVYKELGYSMNATVGKDGVERAFEEYLHGTDGSVTVTQAPGGEVVNRVVNEQATAGQNVYLTVDIGMQEVAEKSLAKTITELNESRDEDEEKATGGAVVVLDVNTGGALVSASYPTYDLNTFLSNYTTLSEDPAQPLFNRATMGVYNPGSTFKMVTSFAGMSSGKISAYSTVTDKGKYTAYEGFQPTCWAYPYASHGTINVVGALKHSCNYFYYWLGDLIGADAISNAAQQFGLASKTGIEISEETGTLATPEYKREALNEDWYAADTLITAIGQGHNMFTPVQLANYIACIANGGTLHSVTLLDKIVSQNYAETVLSSTPNVLNQFDATSISYIEVLQEGMRAVTQRDGTAGTLFGNYKVKVAAKTGTVQSDASEINNGVFVCYAPAYDPEIAIAVVVQNGGSGSGIMSIAKDILDYYFSDYSEDEIVIENTLIP